MFDATDSNIYFRAQGPEYPVQNPNPPYDLKPEPVNSLWQISASGGQPVRATSKDLMFAGEDVTSFTINPRSENLLYTTFSVTSEINSYLYYVGANALGGTIHVQRGPEENIRIHSLIPSPDKEYILMLYGRDNKYRFSVFSPFPFGGKGVAGSQDSFEWCLPIWSPTSRSVAYVAKRNSRSIKVFRIYDESDEIDVNLYEIAVSSVDGVGTIIGWGDDLEREINITTPEEGQAIIRADSRTTTRSDERIHGTFEFSSNLLDIPGLTWDYSARNGTIENFFPGTDGLGTFTFIPDSEEYDPDKPWTPYEISIKILDSSQEVKASDTQRFLGVTASTLKSVIPAGDTKVYISTTYDDVYASSHQKEDASITITAEVKPPYHGISVNFRVLDPPDPSGYVTGADGDNRDSVNKGSFSRNSHVDVTSAVTNSNGIARVTLYTTERYAGDNYRVKAWIGEEEDAYPVFSGIITAWKRIYLEEDRMCRRGGVLYDSYGATGKCGGADQPECCGTDPQLPCNQIKVYDWTTDTISSGNSIKIFDETKPFESSTSEIRTIQSLTDNGDGTKTITLDKDLSHSYYASSRSGSPAMPTFTNGHSGGICLAETYDSSFFNADTSRLNRPDMTGPFDDAFVSFATIPDGSGVVPYLPGEFFAGSNNHSKFNFSRIWFKNFQSSGSGTPPTPAKRNILHIVGATEWSDYLGYAWQGYDLTYIMVKRIEDIFSSNALVVNRDTTAHEMGHQFSVNPDNCDGHDNRQAWCGGDVDNSCGTERCLMNTSRDRTNGISRYCRQDLLLGVPDDGSIYCGGVWLYWYEGDGAIRTMPDPQ